MSTKEGKQKLIDGLVNAIYVYDDNKIGLVCNYKDGTEIISLDEATEGLGSYGNSLSPPDPFVYKLLQLFSALIIAPNGAIGLLPIAQPKAKKLKSRKKSTKK